MDTEINNPKVSIIIPVYNVRDYLRQCIESVIKQTLSEIEIILIDDGSTDGSEYICDEYDNQDERIKVIHKSNQGLSCARNDGIDASTAPYIMFVDADDWIEPEFCELPYKIAVKFHTEIVLITHNIIYSDGSSNKNNSGINDGLVSEAEALYYNVAISNAAWLALYHKHLFDGIRFPDGKYYEDIGVIHRIIHKANSRYLINKPLYNHRMGRPRSITNDPRTRKHPDRKDMFMIRIKDLLSWGYDEYAQELALLMLVRYGCKEDFLVKVAKQTLSIKPKKWKNRLLVRVLNISPTLFDAICIITGKRWT